MTAYEMMLSESQERMLMVLKPGREDEAKRIFEKWELDFAVVGKLTDTGHMVLRHHGEVVADLPIDPLARASPEYDRPWQPAAAPAPLLVDDVAAPNDPLSPLLTLIGGPDGCSKRWIWEQYDHMVMGDTLGTGRPGRADAALVRVHGTEKALAVTSDCTPRYCRADPEQGGRQAVAEAWRNITATGAKPLAITDNMNFGNPEKPEIMAQFVGCCQGMADACRALDFPVVSGNVSLYNETSGQAIQPTPTIGGVGLLADHEAAVGLSFPGDGQAVVLIGRTRGHLGASLYLRDVVGREAGPPPPVDLEAERKHGDFVRGEILAGGVTACHDVADGGLLVAVAEMALAGDLGCELDVPLALDIPLHAWLYGEDQGRYVVTTAEPDALLARAEAAGVPALRIGTTGGDGIVMSTGDAIALSLLRDAHEDWLPRYMAGEDAPKTT